MHDERTETHACENEPCETHEACDCISRQAVIDAADRIIERDASGSNAVVNAMIAWSEYIRTLPSVTPVRPHGHWEYIQYDANPKIGNWHCSECRRIVFLLHSQKQNEKPLYDFCPWCGADMREVQD